MKKMIDGLKVFFAACLAVLGFFLGMKMKSNSEAENLMKDKQEHKDDLDELRVKHNSYIRDEEDKLSRMLDNLDKDRELEFEELEEKYGKDAAKVYEDNRNDTQKLARELSEKYGLNNVDE